MLTFTQPEHFTGSSCNSWAGGLASFSGSDGNWIYATHQSNGPKDSTSQEVSIDQHDDHASFKWSYANAKGGNSVNPLVAAAGSGSGSGSGSGTASAGGNTPTSCIPRPAGAAATSSGTTAAGAKTSQASSKATSTKTRDGDDDDWRSHYGRPTARPTDTPWEDVSKRQELNYCDENGSSNTGFTPISSGGSTSNTKKMLIAHGTLAALAFVIFFPFGSIAVRLASFTGVVWFHAAFQVFAYIVYVIAFGLGITVANEYNLVSSAEPWLSGLVTDIDQALGEPSHHRHCCLRCALLPAHIRIRAPHDVQETSDSYGLVVHSLVARPPCHHAWNHQRRARLPACG